MSTRPGCECKHGSGGCGIRCVRCIRSRCLGLPLRALASLRGLGLVLLLVLVLVLVLVVLLRVAGPLSPSHQPQQRQQQQRQQQPA